MGGVSAEQIAKVREIDLLSYLQTYEPGELKPDGPGRYTTVSHDSLVISKGKWIWNGGGGEGNVIKLRKLQINDDIFNEKIRLKKGIY